MGAVAAYFEECVATRSMTILADLVPAMQRMPQPVICAINGAAIGGGFCLTLGADIRIESESAYFRAAGINNAVRSMLRMEADAARRQEEAKAKPSGSDVSDPQQQGD